MASKVEHLVDLIIDQKLEIERLRSIIQTAINENGLGMTALEKEYGIRPQYQDTIEKLLRQIDKQQKWLEKRKAEITALQNSIANERNKRKLDLAKRISGELNDGLLHVEESDSEVSEVPDFSVDAGDVSGSYDVSDTPLYHP